ncbi:MAG: glycosyltransferase [Deltaproteobacteria bacterium]|jgi:glycosyltransferase involved in cell wall biosynthesis|nr:glycosyltransferase [Deltaproteobacteria bacterium]
MLILCLGSDYFHQAFHSFGHTVLAPPHQEGYPVDSLFNNLKDRPDLIVYVDHLGHHFWPDGLTNIYGVPKVYYAVDAPINFWWQRDFARLFDYVFVDQKTQANILAEEDQLEASWLPVGVDVKSYAATPEDSAQKLYDFGFVGRLDPAHRPKRSRLVDLLSSRYVLKTAGSEPTGWVGPAESGQLYRQSKLALNENLFPGVTTRMLEAMAAGAVLFTEKAGGDLGEIFKAGEDFAWFEPEDILGAAETWLSDDKRRQRVAKRALEKVTGAHDVKHRAEKFLKTIENLNPGAALLDSLAWDREGRALFLTALRWPKEEGFKRVQRAATLLEKAYKNDVIEPLGVFYLGHVERLRNRPVLAKKYLEEAYEKGEARGALGLGIMSLASGDLAQSQTWLARFTGLDDFPSLAPNTLPFEAVKILGQTLREMGEVVSPGFSRLAHDPSVWQAFEFYQTAVQSRPSDLESSIAMAEILLECGATAEAVEVCQKALTYHPEDEKLMTIFARAGQASYLAVN